MAVQMKLKLNPVNSVGTLAMRQSALGRTTECEVLAAADISGRDGVEV